MPSYLQLAQEPVWGAQYVPPVLTAAFPWHGKVLAGDGLARTVSAPRVAVVDKCPRSRSERAGRGLIGAWLQPRRTAARPTRAHRIGHGQRGGRG